MGSQPKSTDVEEETERVQQLLRLIPLSTVLKNSSFRKLKQFYTGSQLHFLFVLKTII